MTGEVIFDPLLPWPVIWLLAGLSAAVVALALWRGLSGWALRGLAAAVLVAALAQPALQREERQGLSDIVILVVDETASQRLPGRADQTAAAVAAVEAEVAALPNTELRRVTLRDAGEDAGSLLLTELAAALAEEPRARIAGAILVSDGQAHDLDLPVDLPAPLHLIQTGLAGDWDRRLVIETAPTFGIIGEPVSILMRVEEQGALPTGEAGRAVTITIAVDGGPAEAFRVPVGRALELPVTLDHAGQNVVQVTLETANGELTDRNNAAVIQINGVRDRLRVLLVSGQPHAGERTWRNLLKSDPSVDLVHFTILRPPEKNDFTPLNEISLIAFPVRELFEEKIDEFDLIVFDRYVVRDVLPPSYFRNIANYVRGGGAVLLAVGPEYGGLRSLTRTPLSDILPATPTGEVFENKFKPRISETGHRHPVTSGLPGAVVPGRDDLEPTWGAWFRQVGVTASVAPTLMQGDAGNPLLVMERVDEGRVALFSSDHLWLWARGYDGGGPQAELMRRIAHWLMKEPELDEEGLFARVEDGEIRIERRSLTPGNAEVILESPSGETRTVTLEAESAGRAVARLPVEEVGLYRVRDEEHLALAPAGPLNPLELADLRATDGPAKQLADAANGSVRWLVDGMPSVRGVQKDRQTAGTNWVGFVRNEAFTVTGITTVPLAPWWLVILLGVGFAALAWWREGR